MIFCKDKKKSTPLKTSAQIELEQHYPKSGWVEHDANDIWEHTLAVCKKAMKQAKLTAKDMAGIGISNQRETTVVWNKKTGKPVYKAIVWQDRRTSSVCEQLKSHEVMITEKTGLLLDPYFSATKISWILDNVKGARKLAVKGDLLFGTIDTFLLWYLTGGKTHATDATNASRTMLFNIRTQQWDDELLALFNVPKSVLPEVRDCASNFGDTGKLFKTPIRIAGIAGDQQAAAFGQACFKPGMVKSTYGTGCFVLMNTGDQVVMSQNRLLSTVAYRLNGKVNYGIEGSVFVAGAAIQWLRDLVHMVKTAADSEKVAKSVKDTGGVYLVPAFVGLGAPHWDPQARGALLGLTRDSGVPHIVRAALEAVCYQAKDLMVAMEKDSNIKTKALRVDGGMTKNNFLLQFLSDILEVTIQRPECVETSALGAAFIAGLQVGVFSNVTEIEKLWASSASCKPKMKELERKKLYDGWTEAVKRTGTV